MTEYIARSGWTSASRGGSQLATGPVLGIAVHWPGSSTNAYGIESKSTVAARLRSWRDYHLSRTWSDIGYNFAIDQTGRVWDLRGAGRVGAHCASAAWPEANHYYIGVLLILGDEEEPSAAMVDAFRDFRTRVFFARFGTDADDITEHGEVRGAQTACPGPRVREAINDGDLGGQPSNGDNEGESMSWGEDLSRGTPGSDITKLADDTLPDAASRRAAGLLGYAASAFYYVRSSGFRNRITNRRPGWKSWHVNIQPDLPEKWKNGATLIAMVQDNFVRIRRAYSFKFMRDEQGRAFWSRAFNGEGPSHGLRLVRTDQTVSDLQREVAAIRATVDQIAEANGLSREAVESAVMTAIEESLLRVSIDVNAAEDTGEDVIAAEAEQSDAEVNADEIDDPEGDGQTSA